MPSFHLPPWLIALLCTLCLSPAAAQQRSFQVPALPLDRALLLFAEQAGAEVFIEGDLSPLTGNPVSGSHSLESGLQQLLDGTDARFRIEQQGNQRLIRVQRDSPVSDNAIRLGPVRVQGSLSPKDDAYRAPGSVSVISRADIERFRGTSVGDIFQDTAGVLVSENRNSGGLDVNIRGMQGQGRVPVLVDGTRQETTVYRGYAGVSSRSYIDPDLVGGIRIDKGPVMSAEGTGATGGVVSVNTLRAEDVIRPGNTSGIRLRGSLTGNNSSAPAPGTYAGYYVPTTRYRSDCDRPVDCTPQYTVPERFDTAHGMDRPELLDLRGLSGSLAAARRFEWGELVAAFSKRQQGNYYSGKHGPTPYVVQGEPVRSFWWTETSYTREGASPFRGGERIPNTQFSNESWLLKGSLLLPRDQSLELSYLRYDSAFGEMMPSQIRSFGQARQWLDSDVTNHTYSARYRWEPLEYDWADLKLALWHTDTVTDMNTPGVGSVDLSGNTPRRDDYQRFGLDLSNRSNFFVAGVWQFEYGVSLQHERMDTDTPDSGGFYDGSRSGERDEGSAFLSVGWQPVPAWTFAAGTRYTRFRSRDNNPLTISPSHPDCQPDGNGGCIPVYFRNQRSGSAPIFSVTWEPLDGLQFYARHAEALRMPSLFEGTSGWSVSPVQNITLKPEHAKNRELGLNYLKSGLLDEQDKLRFSLAYFRNHSKDYLTRTQPNAWELGPGLDLFRLRNIDSATFHGWELNLDYDAGRWFAALSGTRYSHIEICNTGSFVRYYCTDWGLPQSYINNMVPPTWHASSTLGLRLLEQRLELGMRGTFMGKRTPIPRYNAPAGFNPPIPWHRYTLLDLFASYRVDERLSLDLAINNVTDRYYLDALSLGLVPAPGRTARLGLTVQF